jgi:hypothetical protein
MTRVEHVEPSPSAEASASDAIIALANDTRAPWIASDARRITALAAESRAPRVERYVAEHQRHLCIRLGHHLFEQRRALVCSPAALLARINALSIARVLAENVIETRAREPDPARQTLAASLAVERTKFLMATKADALLALDVELVGADRPRDLFRAAAATTSHAIAVELHAGFRQRMSAEIEKPIAALSKALLSDLEVSLGDLGENISPHALTGFDLPPIRGLRRDIELPASSRRTIADRCGLASRRHVQTAARDYLVDTLAQGSRRVIDRALFDYDEATRAIEYRFCELLDAGLGSVQVAAELAHEAQRSGPDGVARARDRIDQWLNALDAIMARST